MVAELNNLPREAHFRTLQYDKSTQNALYSKISYKVALDKPLFNRDSNLQFLRNHYDSTTSHFNARKQFCTSPVLQHPSKSLDPKTQITPSLTLHFQRRSFSRIDFKKISMTSKFTFSVFSIQGFRETDICRRDGALRCSTVETTLFRKPSSMEKNLDQTCLF